MWRGLLVFLLLGAQIAFAAPLPEVPSGRRAVRGTPLETAHESDELKAMREFDEESFPRPLPGGGTSFGAPPDGIDNGVDPGPARTATGGLGPDAVRPELRSPIAHEPAPDAPSAIPWLHQIKLPDLPVRLDARVIRYLEFYKNDKRGRAIMSSWLEAEGRWRPLFEAALARAHLPRGLIYDAMIESGFDPHDRSSAGAVGLWQFMPSGAKIYGLRVDYWVDERENPERSTEAVTHYFADLKSRFGAWPLALAAFNAGYGAVLRAMQKYNTNDYWELCKHEDGLPWDTMLYVPKVMAAAIVGENRALFGYAELPRAQPYAFDQVMVPTSMSLTAIARAAGVSVDAVEALNPELRRKRTPPEPWQARVPKGAGARFAANYEREREKVKPFVIRFGERLADVAREHGVSEHELRRMNGIEDSTEVRPGLTLVVPDGKASPASGGDDTVIVAVPDKDAVVAGRKRVFYRTLPQDSPAAIADFFQVKPSDLQRWNNLDLDAKLASNMVLQVWVPRGFDTSKAALVDPATVRVVTTGSEEFFDLVEARRGRVRLSYTVRKSDDLKRIGRRFGLTVADLERINRFGAKHTELHVGQKLIVYRNMTASEKRKAAAKIKPGGLVQALDPPTADPLVDEEEAALPTPRREARTGDAPLPLGALPRLPGT
ncbi:MAG TPA: LysM peptidoglycan-binding domain-containing protein [Polyangia bacterium]